MATLRDHGWEVVPEEEVPHMIASMLADLCVSCDHPAEGNGLYCVRCDPPRARGEVPE